MSVYSLAIHCMDQLYLRLANPWYVRSSNMFLVTRYNVFQVLIKHRASDEDLLLVENILRHLRSRYVYLTYEQHDEVTANTQAVTHAAFLRYNLSTPQCICILI